MPVNHICRQAGISVPTYYQWKSKYGGIEASDQKRVKELKAENARLKPTYAELALYAAAMKPAQKREADILLTHTSRQRLRHASLQFTSILGSHCFP